MESILTYEQFLNEATIRELLDMYKGKEEDFRTTYLGLVYRYKTFVFDVEGNDKHYECRLQLPDFGIVSRMKGDIRTKLDLAIRENVKVHCTCPSWLYSGYQYIGTQLDYAIKFEDREPVIRNPNLEGSVCKHLYHLLRNVEAFETDMVRSLVTAKDRKYVNDF